MKIKIKQEKLVSMLEKLMVNNMFPSCVITAKDGLFSIQREEHGRALRFAKFSKDYFDFIEGKESIDFNAEKLIGIAKRIPAGTDVSIDTSKGKIRVEAEFDGRRINPTIAYMEPEEVIDSLNDANIDIKDGIPFVGKEKNVKLETHFEVKLQDIKDIVDYGSALGTEFYKFYFEKKKPVVRVGDLHAHSDDVTYYPKGEIKKGEGLEVVFTYGIPQVASVFDKDVSIKTKSNCPGWFYESGDGYVLGVLLPPYVEDEES